MNKKTIAMLLIASSFTSSVFTANFIDKIVPRHDFAIPANAKCTNRLTKLIVNTRIFPVRGLLVAMIALL